MAIKERRNMSGKRYPEEFKIAAIRQITEGGYAVSEVASRLDVTTHSLYGWLKKYGPDSAQYQAKTAEQAELNRLRKELKRVTEERDLLKKAAAYFAKQSD
jgi:transposase